MLQRCLRLYGFQIWAGLLERLHPRVYTNLASLTVTTCKL